MSRFIKFKGLNGTEHSVNPAYIVGLHAHFCKEDTYYSIVIAHYCSGMYPQEALAIDEETYERINDLL